MRIVMLLAIAATILFSTGRPALAGGLEIPLAVRETAGIARLDNPVNSGVPLPKGAVKDASELRLLDDKGNVILASIVARARWLDDDSIKWVTVHFIVPSLDAKATLNYKLAASNAALPKSPLVVTQGEKTITAVTGPAKFVVPTAGAFGPFEQVFVGDAAMLTKPASVTLVARNGKSKVTSRPDRPGEFKSEVVTIDEQPFTQTALIKSAEVEERGPGRAVVALRGTFSTKEHPSLDFVARLYFYAGSPLAQMTFSVINAQMDGMEHFVGIERLAVEMPIMVLPLSPTVVTVEIDGKQLHANTGSRLVQASTDKVIFSTPDGKTVEGRKSDGWVQCGGTPCHMTAGTRWFWQVHPSGVAIGHGWTVALELKAADTERVDLYTAGAKTNFMFFRFGTNADTENHPAAIAAGTMYPLVATCSPDWYCQQTRAMGDLYSANPKNFDPKYQDLIARYQKFVDGCIHTIVENRARPGWPVDEYGWLNFGSGLHDKNLVRENAAESWWDGNYYDFPHAAILNFLRTGDTFNLTTAEEAGLHLADIDICHCFPGSPEQAGSPRSGPVVGHFRDYINGQVYEGHNAFTFYKNESLYELYYLTGEKWYHDVAIMSSDFAVARWGRGQLRNVAHGIWGVLSGYQDTHDKKYLDRARFFFNDWAKPWQDKYGGSFHDQLWMYGLVFEAYDKYFRVTGDKQVPAYLVKALDAFIAESWQDGKQAKLLYNLYGLNVFGFGLGYEYTGEAKYLTKGVELLDWTVSKPGACGDRVKTFAQEFRSSPYFLKYLTAGYKPTPILGK